jgi:hypothetical protein
MPRYHSICLEAHCALRDRLDRSFRCSECTYSQTIPQVVDNPGQSNTKCRARVKKRDFLPSRKRGEREVWVSFATRRTAVHAHAACPSSGADVGRGSSAPVVPEDYTSVLHCQNDVVNERLDKSDFPFWFGSYDKGYFDWPEGRESSQEEQSVLQIPGLETYVTFCGMVWLRTVV